MERGFILQPTYRIERGRPVVHLFGVTEEGESFVVRDTRTRPSFFVRTEDLPRATPILEEVRAAAAERTATPENGFPHIGPRAWETLGGAPAAEIVVAIPQDVPPLRELLRSAGIACHEADIPFVTRFLCDQGICGALRFRGEARKGRHVKRIYEDVQLVPDEYEPDLRVLSLDIETDPEASRVFSFALFGHFPHEGQVAEVHYVRHPQHGDAPGSVGGARGAALCYGHADEPDLLRALIRRVREIDPDVLTGWNVIDFDLRVLQAAFGRCDLPFYLGRADLACRVRPRTDTWMSGRATVHGRAVIDGVDLLRGAFVRMESYALGAVAHTLLGEGKVFSDHDEGREIERRYVTDLPTFLLYNLTDARLVIQVLEKLELVPLAVRRSLLTGLPIDRVAASIAAFDFLYLGALHRRGVVAPSVQEAESDARGGPAPIGGHVLESVPGIYDNVWLFDYRSLYPSIIRTFCIDPLGHARAATRSEAEVLRAPNDATFLRGEGILPHILERLFPKREEAQRRGQSTTATAIKILMNSFYGVLATPRCRFFSTHISNAITTFGQEILLWTKGQLEEMGFFVIYGDTDSVFVLSGLRDPDEADEKGRAIVAELNARLDRWVAETHALPSHLRLEFERLYLKFFMPTLRHGREGSKKRYAGMVRTTTGRELVFTGLESVRRDWTVLAKDFQRHLLMRVLEGREVESFCTALIRELRDGKRDGDLIYRKALRKRIEEYGKTTPPHVKAARLLPGKPGKVISYVMTTEGPQPVGHVTAPPDYDHYLEKQLRPIAESILVHVGMSFDELLGKGKQLGLL